MVLFSRLFRILRANIRFNKNNHNWDRFAHYREQYQHKSHPGSSESSGFEQRRPQVDPVLAGYYANLEVPYGSDIETVRQAWKRLVRKYHPDLHSRNPEKRRIANELTQGLNRAYEELAKQLQQ